MMLNANDSQLLQLPSSNNDGGKKKRLPTGTPDPEAEVVSLSPKTLLETDRFVCEICNQGFQRDQNLQMHRRRHKVPWKLAKRDDATPKRRVYVCPEPTCLHHDAGHALGDLVGIKKHYRRKHSNQKQWVCYKCSKGYAVQSDYKAHLKTCGTRGHSCDCGRVFSRVESFIEHQDVCNIRLRSLRPPPQTHRLLSVSGPISTGVSATDFLTRPQPKEPVFLNPPAISRAKLNLELQLLTTENEVIKKPYNREDSSTTLLHLSIGSPSASTVDPQSLRLKEHSEKQLKQAMADKAHAAEARWQAHRQVQLAEQELSDAKRIRQQAAAELMKAQVLKEVAASKPINPFTLHLTCDSCSRKRLQQGSSAPVQAEASSSHESSLMPRHSIAEMKGWEMKKGFHE